MHSLSVDELNKCGAQKILIHVNHLSIEIFSIILGFFEIHNLANLAKSGKIPRVCVDLPHLADFEFQPWPPVHIRSIMAFRIWSARQRAWV